MPSVVAPSLKVTVPVAEAAATFAVIVTGCPTGAAPGVTARVVWLPDAAAGLICSVTTAEVLGALEASPA